MSVTFKNMKFVAGSPLDVQKITIERIMQVALVALVKIKFTLQIKTSSRYLSHLYKSKRFVV